MSNTGSETPSTPPPPPTGATGKKQRRSVLGGVFRQLGHMTHDVVSAAMGLLPESGNDADNPDGNSTLVNSDNVTTPRLRLLEGVTNQLRGAADSYIAAKLDEIEARVDAKLDHIEARIDAKIVELELQLRQVRDKELRHRLRLLKITLIFTVIVAVLSLGYKWISTHWVS